jgi:homocysteine S-methyltransferase
LPLLEQLQQCELGATRLLVYPNSGEHYDATDKCWHGQADIQRFSIAAAQWLAAGANWIGGCCRTTPAHIQALQRELNRQTNR